jgi:hypothetical protein
MAHETLLEPRLCPDCGSTLTRRIEGFRPATPEEQDRLTPEAIRLLGLCSNEHCPGRDLIPRQRRPEQAP